MTGGGQNGGYTSKPGESGGINGVVSVGGRGVEGSAARDGNLMGCALPNRDATASSTLIPPTLNIALPYRQYDTTRASRNPEFAARSSSRHRSRSFAQSLPEPCGDCPPFPSQYVADSGGVPIPSLLSFGRIALYPMKTRVYTRFPYSRKL